MRISPSSLSVCTRFDPEGRSCTRRAGATVDGSAWFAAAQVGAAVGWKHVWFAAELTVARFSATADGTVTGDTTMADTSTYARHFAPTDVVLYPAFGLLGRF